MLYNTGAVGQKCINNSYKLSTFVAVQYNTFGQNMKNRLIQWEMPQGSETS